MHNNLGFKLKVNDGACLKLELYAVHIYLFRRLSFVPQGSHHLKQYKWMRAAPFVSIERSTLAMVEISNEEFLAVALPVEGNMWMRNYTQLFCCFH